MNYSEEHHLIARYAAQLNRHESGQQQGNSSRNTENDTNDYIDRQKQLITQLEERNRLLMQEISKLRFNRNS